MSLNDSSAFFPATYFSPYYFTGYVLFGAADDSAAAWGATYRDRDAFAAILKALSGTGEFADVLLGMLPERRTTGADRTPVAVVSPEGWTELDDVDPAVSLRHVGFSLSLVVRDEDTLNRYESLDRLSCLAQNALDGTDLGGVCLPGLTKIRRGRFDAGSKHPEQAVTLHGEFSYLITASDGHNTDP